MQQPPSQSAGGAGSELRSDAKQLGSTAANRLHSEVDARKGTAATQAKSAASAIQRAAGELDEGAPTWLKSAFQQGADQIQRFADAIDQKDSRQLVSEAQSFARNNPGTFLAACAAAGFAAARIFKAGGQQQSSSLGQWDQNVQVDSPSGDSAMFRSSSPEPSIGSSSQPNFGANPRGEFV